MSTETTTLKASARALEEARKNLLRLHEMAQSHVDEARRANDMQAAKANLDDAVRAYEDASAGHALGEVDSGELEIARQNKLNAERDHAQFDSGLRQLDAFTAGLMRRVSAAEDVVKQAEAAHREACANWAKAELDAADAEYLRCALGVAAAAHRFSALRTWMHLSHISTPGRPRAVHDIELPALGEISLAHLYAVRPYLMGTGNAWLANIVDHFHFDSGDSFKAVVCELETLAQDPSAGAAGDTGLMAGARRLVRKLAPPGNGDHA